MKTLSSLYRRYNGFMLGLVFSANTLLTGNERYLVHRRRMKELFDEIGVDVFLPETHLEFADVGVELVTLVGETLHERDGQLYDYWFLGLSACGLAHTQDADPQVLDKVNAQFEDAARSCGVARTEYLRYQGAVSKLADQQLSWSRVLDPGYGLATSLISSVKPEDDTCFVVMPFSVEFARRYELFYRPALNTHGYRTIRAWDGFGGEAYLDLLRVLIERCGSVFADLSEDPGVGFTNPNVLHEVGMAHGLGRLTFLAVEEGWDLPGNLRQLSKCRYARDEDAWPESAIAAFDRHKTLMDSTFHYARESQRTIELAATKSPYSPEG